MIFRLIFFLFLISCKPLVAQQQSLLYSIKSKNTETSYLFGTVHLIADSAFYFPEKLEKILYKTEELVLEIDNLNDRSQLQGLLLRESGSVFDIFSTPQKDSVINWGSTQLKMSKEAFQKGFSSRKLFSLLQIETQMMMNGPVKSYELELLGRANGKNLVIGGLETVQYQIQLFDQFPDSALAEMVMESIRHPEKSLEESKKLTQLYQNQDVEGLAKLILEDPEMAITAEKMVFQRNRNWIPIIENKLKNHACFFAVGAGHLGGEKGVINLLKAQGYTVTPINY